jgi:hypothetical protein
LRVGSRIRQQHQAGTHQGRSHFHELSFDGGIQR